MADALGILAKMGSVTRTTWAQPWTTVTVLEPYLTESLTSNFSQIPNDTLQGYGGRLPGDQGVETLQGATEHHLNYNSLHKFITAVMGLDTTGTITITDSVTDKYFGFEFEKQVKRWRFWPCKAGKVTISGEKDKHVKMVVDWYAKNFELVDTAFPALSQPSNVLVPFDDLVFRIADQVDALAAGDAVGIESFEIVFDRAYKADDYQSDATAPRQPLEPISGDWRVCTLGIKIPRYAAATFETWKDGNTALQADLIFTGPGTATQKYEFPELRITDGFNQNIGGPGPLTIEGKFEAYRSSAGNPMYVGNEMRVIYTT